MQQLLLPQLFNKGIRETRKENLEVCPKSNGILLCAPPSPFIKKKKKHSSSLSLVLISEVGILWSNKNLVLPPKP